REIGSWVIILFFAASTFLAWQTAYLRYNTLGILYCLGRFAFGYVQQLAVVTDAAQLKEAVEGFAVLGVEATGADKHAVERTHHAAVRLECFAFVQKGGSGRIERGVI